MDALIPLVYGELREIAHRALRRQPQGQTLQTMDLIHEAYLRLQGGAGAKLQDRAHFFAIAARVMRFLLVDRARAKAFAKRGGAARQVSLSEAMIVSAERPDDLLALDEALQRLAEFDEQKCRVVEMRYFAGMSVEEVAEVLGIAPATVKREWARSKAWLFHELGGELGGAPARGQE